MGIEPAAALWTGRFVVPPQPAAARLYWRALCPPGERRAARVLGRACPRLALRCSGARRAAADAALQQLEARWARQFDRDVQFIWRPAAPGASRATLGWVVQRGRVRAMVRYAPGETVGFLQREREALEQVARWPALAASTPRLLLVDVGPDSLGLMESACAGSPLPLAADPPAAAAHWLATLQVASIGDAAAAAAEHGSWQTPLAAAVSSHPDLTATTRARLLERLATLPPTVPVAAHGDFWHANLLQGEVLSVVDWSEFRPCAHPFLDAGFFLLTHGRDRVSRGRRLPPHAWLTRAWSARAPFHRRARRWWAEYHAALASTLPGLGRRFGDLLEFLPLAMAHYACYGQQAAAWAAACNAWAEQPALLAPTTRPHRPKA